MNMYLLGIRMRVALEHAEDQPSIIENEVGVHAFELSASGDTTHYLLRWDWGASHLLARLAPALNQSFVDDFGAVEVRSIEHVIKKCAAERGSDAADVDPEFGDRSYGYDAEPPDLNDWWREHGPPLEQLRGFRRRALLLATADDRSRHERRLSFVTKQLGRGGAGHWHGRESILNTFWDSGRGASVIDGRLAREIEDKAIAEAYLFDLGNDHAAKHGELSTMATWFARDVCQPWSGPTRPRSSWKAPSQPAKFNPVKGPVIVEVRRRRPKTSFPDKPIDRQALLPRKILGDVNASRCITLRRPKDQKLRDTESTKEWTDHLRRNS